MTVAAVVPFDPLRDSRHKTARAAREVADALAHKELEGLAPRTLDDLERVLAKLVVLIDKDVRAYTPDDLSHFLRTYPPASRRKTRSHLSSFFKWLVLTEKIDRNPLDIVPRMKRPAQKVIDVFSDAECALLEGLPQPDGPLMSILLRAGLRKSEARRLQGKHINLDRRHITILAGKGGKDRLVSMGRLVPILADWFLFDAIQPDEYLWYSRPGGGKLNRTRPIGEGSFHRWWEHAVERAGVEYRNPHTTRHTYATTWLRAGGRLETLSKQMGHASIKTTADLYAHLSLDDAAADLELVEA
jgi:integrase